MIKTLHLMRKVYHVVPHFPIGWEVDDYKGVMPSGVHADKCSATLHGEELAKEEPAAMLVIHSANGMVEAEYFFGER
jgi:hypothetical protein